MRPPPANDTVRPGGRWVTGAGGNSRRKRSASMSVSRFVLLGRSVTGRRGIVLGAAVAALAVAIGLASEPARSAPTPLAVSVTGAQPVYLEQTGGTANVAIVMTTANGQP